MAEIQIYDYHESEWTPKAIYDVIPPNALAFQGFEYGEGSDNVDKEKVNKSLLDAFVDFFKNLLGTVGQIIGGAVNLGAGVFTAVADGVKAILGGIFGALKNIFGFGDYTPPAPIEVLSPFQADLETVVKPHLDNIKKNIEEIGLLQDNMDSLTADIGVLDEKSKQFLEDSKLAAEEAKKAATDAETAIRNAQSATDAVNSLEQDINRKLLDIPTQEKIDAQLADYVVATTFTSKMNALDAALLENKNKLTGIDGQLSTIKTDLSDAQKQVAAKVNTADYNQKMATLDSSIKASSDLIALKVNTSEYQTKIASLDGSLSTLNTNLAKKVDTTAYQTKMTQLDTDLGKAKTDVASALTEVAKKVNTVDYQTKMTALDGSLSTLGTDLDAAELAISKKVNTVDYQAKMTALDTDLGKAKTDVSTALTEVAKKVNTVDYQTKMTALDTDLGKAKADVSTALAEVAKKVDSSKLTADLQTVNSSIDMARAEALKAGLLTPGNLVYNPKFETDTSGRVIGWLFNSLPVTRSATGGYRDSMISVTYPVVDEGYRQAIYSAYPDHKLMVPAGPGRSFKLTVRVRPKVALPAGALNLRVYGGTVSPSPAFPAGEWTKWEATSTVSAELTGYKGTWFAIFSTTLLPAGSVVDFSEPEMAEAANKWLIIDGSVSMDKLAANSVDASKIVAGSITAKELGADSVTANQIKAGEVKAVALATDSVTAGKIASDAITSREIKAGSIAADDIQANSITASQIATGAITADELAANAVLAENIKAGEVTAGKLAADSVVATNIKAGEITGSKLAVDAIGTRELAANAVLAENIKAGEITGDKIKAGSILAENIGADQITGKQIAAGAISADELAAKSVYAGALQADSVLAENIKAGEITGEKIKAGAVTAREIASRSITTSHLTIVPGNLFPDPHFQDPSWQSGNPNVVPNTTANGGQLTLVGNGVQTGVYLQPKGMPDSSMVLEPGSAHRLSATVWLSATTVNHLAIYMRYLSTADTIKGALMGTIQFPGSGLRQATLNFTTPADMKDGSCTLGFFIQSSIASGSITIWNVSLQRAADSALIVQGAVRAEHIEADSINSNHIGAGEIVGRNIFGGTIQSAHLASNSVTAGKIDALAITSRELQADAVTAGKIDAKAVTAREVAANSIYANHLVVAQPGNLIANGDFASGQEPWDSKLQVIKLTNTVPPNGRYAVTAAGAGSLTIPAHGVDNWFSVEPGQSYAFEIWLWTDTPGSQFYLQCLNQDGSNAGTAGVVVNDGDGYTGGSGYLVNGVTLAATWQRYSCVYKMGPKTTMARLGTFWFNHQNGVTTGRQAIGGVTLRPMADASLIVDGSITAKQIKAETITGAQIASKSINTVNIASKAITADEIKSGTITAKEIASKAITTSHLAITPGNLVYNPTFANGDGWNVSNATVTWNTDLDSSNGKLDISTSSTGDVVLNNTTQKVNGAQVSVGDTVRVSITVSSTTVTAANSLWIGFYGYDSSGAYKGTYGLMWQEEIPANTPTRIFTKVKVQPGVSLALIRLWFKSNTGTYSVENPMMSLASDASLIVDGSVTANSIVSGAITSTHIGSEQIVGNHIKAGSIRAGEIQAQVFTQVGSSILPVKPGTADGAWVDQSISSGSDASAGKYYDFKVGTTVPVYNNSVVVDPTVEYDLDVWLKTATAGATLQIQLVDQNGSNAVLNGGLINNSVFTSPNSAGTITQGGTAALVNMPLQTAWKRYKSRVTLRPGVRSVRVGNIIVAGGVVSIADMQLYQHVVDQKKVDQLQNEAIKRTEIVGTTNTTSLALLQQAFEAKQQSDDLRELREQDQAAQIASLRNNDEMFAQMQKLSMKVMTRFISGKAGAETYNEHMRLKPDKGEVEFYSGWTGPVTLLVGKPGSGDGYVDIVNYTWVPGASNVLKTSASGFPSSEKWIVAIYQVEAGVQKSLTISSTSGYLSNKVVGSWVAMAQVTAPVDTSYFATAEFQLRNANRGSEYGMRITVNGVSVVEYRNNRIGPLTSLGSGTAYRNVSGNLTNIKKGDIIKLEGLVNGAAEFSQMVDFFQAKLTYIDSTGE